MRKSEGGTPIALGLLMPKQDCNVLDTWHVLGMRGTGSTEFEVNGAFVPKDLAIRFFGAESQYPYPIFHLPPTYFGYNHVSVLNGIARAALDGLKTLARTKTSAMAGTNLRDEPQAQYAVAKAEAMIEANRLTSKNPSVHSGRKWWPASPCRSKRAPACGAASRRPPNVRSRPCNSAIAQPEVLRSMNQHRSSGPSGTSTQQQPT
jgi:alkylation response protein AidB-like acyl-CoA dehydrogenase